MSPEWVSILALVALFVVGTVLPINMGALGFVAAWLVGMYSLGLDEKEIIAGISGDLILTLVGVTYLFAIARNNGTVDLIVRSAVRAVGGRVALIPWVMFVVTAVLTAIGAASPAACAIIGPIALGFAGRYKINPLMMGMIVVHGAQAGGFSPISIYGTITNSVMARTACPSSEIAVFLTSLIVNLAIAVALFFVLGGRQLTSRRLDADELGPRPRPAAVPAGGAGRRATDAATGPRWARRPRDPAATSAPCTPAIHQRPDGHPGRVRRRRRRRAGLRQEHRLRLDHRRGGPRAVLPKAAEGRRLADRLADRAAGRRGEHLRGDPERPAPGVRRQLGRRTGRGRSSAR